MSKTYSDKLRDPRWQKRRLEVLNNAEWACEDCGNAASELQVHHTAYHRSNEPWDYGEEWLMSLCSDCHLNRQKLEDSIRMVVGKITRLLSAADLETEVFLLENDLVRMRDEIAADLRSSPRRRLGDHLA